MKQDTRWLWIFRCFFGIIALGLLLFCGWRYFAVSGNLSITQHFTTEDDSILSVFIPHDRAGDLIKNTRTGETAQVITETPVYLTAKVPRAFDAVTATIQYTTDYRGPITFGVVELLTPFAVKEKIIDVPLVREAIAAHWKVVTDEASGTTVYSPDGLSFADAQQRARDGKAIATVNADMQVPYRDTGYTSAAATFTIPNELRGSHVFSTYIKDEVLSFSVDLIDQNTSGGPDPVSVIVVNENNEVVHDERLADDGNQEASRQAASVRKVAIEKAELTEGVYRIVLQTTNDMILQNITTAQEKFVVKDRVTFGKREQSASLQIGSDFIAAETGNAESFQTILVGERTLDLDQRGKIKRLDDFYADVASTVLVALPLGDATVSFSGYAAFSPEAYFDPDFAIQTITAETQLSDIVAIVTKDFTPPIENYRGIEATVSIPLTGVLTDRKNLEFTLNAPELLLQKEAITIDSIQFDFQRSSLWGRVQQRFFE